MKYTLKDISLVNAGNSSPSKDKFSTEGKPFIRAGSLEFLVRGVSIDKCEKIGEITAKIEKLKLFPKGTILFAKSGMSSKLGRIYQLGTDAYVVSHLAAITTKVSFINSTYLKYFFQYRPPFNLIRDDAYPSISLPSIEKIEIDLPELQIQNKIVAILDKISSLIEKKEQSIQLLDELLKAKFLDIFGDLYLNERNWSIEKNGNLCNVQGGLQITPKRKTNPIEIPYLRVANVFRGYFELNEIKTIRVTENEIERILLQKDDILIVEGHGNFNEIGRAAIWSCEIDKILHQNHLIRLRVVSSKINAVFLTEYLNSYSGKYQMKSISNTTSGLNTISTGKVKSLKIPIPPYDLQAYYEKLYLKIKKDKAKLISTKNQLQLLSNAIIQNAFNGGLNFNIDLEIDALLKESDINRIKSDKVYLQRLVDRLKGQEFENKEIYDTAKSILFQLLKEGSVVTQDYNETLKSINLVS